MPGPRPETLDLLARLVGFNTVSAQSNRALIDFAREVLAASGAHVDVFADATGAKANLIARIGPEAPGGLMLAGHSDVVPVEGQEWQSDPFEATVRGDRIYGRGTCDMKGFIAVALSLAPELAAADLRRPVYLAFTYDEEVGCFGAAELAPRLSRLPAKPAFCIVGEPTGMRVISGHKGKLSLDCRVHGTEGHSAHNDRAVNAVEIAAEVIVRLRALQRRIASEGHRDERFDPPFTTIHTGIVEGGVARNIVPRDCRFEVEIRNLPDDDARQLFREIEEFAASDLLPEMHRLSRGAGITFDVQSDIPALVPQSDGELLGLALARNGTNRPDVVSFATEAGLYQGTDMQVIVCGPGDIRDAHRPDEFVALDQLARCETFLRAVIDDVARRRPS